jgi:hypothetical protein
LDRPRNSYCSKRRDLEALVGAHEPSHGPDGATHATSWSETTRITNHPESMLGSQNRVKTGASPACDTSLRSRLLRKVPAFKGRPRLFFAFPHATALPAGMPALARNCVQVVQCKGYRRNVPTLVEVGIRVGLIAVHCPVCLERRWYIVSTEVFLGQPSWGSRGR